MLTSVNMTDTRNWSTKTLATQLAKYLVERPEINKNWTVGELINALKSSIVEDAGVDLDAWASE